MTDRAMVWGLTILSVVVFCVSIRAIVSFPVVGMVADNPFEDALIPLLAFSLVISAAAILLIKLWIVVFVWLLSAIAK